MSDALTAAKQKAEATYNAAADNFDAGPLGFWERYGRRTVERLDLARGARVLDVCCGSGASALPAARTVGAEGRVIGVDLADRLLDLARATADAQGLSSTEFRRADRTSLDPLSDERARDVRREVLAFPAENAVDRVETNVIYAVAEKDRARV
jgi:ubiquinone/menaquinone biosynthesis C-methylase UbiE